MATKRSVIVASSTTNTSKKYETDATTWGQLKGVIGDLLIGDLEAVVNPGNVTLSSDGSTLPTGDFKVYLIPRQNKAGTISPADARYLGEEIGKAIVEAANKATKEDVNSLREALRAEIENFFDVSLGSVDDCEGCEETLAEAQALVASRR